MTLNEILKDKRRHAVIWCRLLEVSFGELANWQNQAYDYELAAKYKPANVSIQSINTWNTTEDMPENWEPYLKACMKKYRLDK